MDKPRLTGAGLTIGGAAFLAAAYYCFNDTYSFAQQLEPASLRLGLDCLVAGAGTLIGGTSALVGLDLTIFGSEYKKQEGKIIK